MLAMSLTGQWHCFVGHRTLPVPENNRNFQDVDLPAHVTKLLQVGLNENLWGLLE